MVAFALVSAVGIAFFWIAFFTVGVAPENPPEGYFVYQHSFPLPDSFVVLSLSIGALLRIQRKDAGFDLLTAGAGGLVFLGLADMSFNALNGSYTKSIWNFFFTMIQNLWCILVGAWIIWKCRRAGKIS